MAIIRFDPFSRDFLGGSALRPFFEDRDEWPELTMTEGLNVYEEGNKVIVEAPVPGIPADKVEITYEDGVLHIAGRSEEKDVEKNKNRVVHRMQRVSSFDYTTYLPRAIDEKKIEADVADGVVTITAPVATAAQAKRIPVRTKNK